MTFPDKLYISQTALNRDRTNKNSVFNQLGNTYKPVSSFVPNNAVEVGAWVNKKIAEGIINVTGTSTSLTAKSIPFADASGILTEDNANLYYDTATDIFWTKQLKTGVVPAALGLDGTGYPIVTFGTGGSRESVFFHHPTAMGIWKAGAVAGTTVFKWIHSRGTLVAPTTLVAGDDMMDLRIEGYTATQSPGRMTWFLTEYTGDSAAGYPYGPFNLYHRHIAGDNGATPGRILSANAGVVILGDVDGTGNASNLTMDDTGELLTLDVGGFNFIFVDSSGGVSEDIFIGDAAFAGNSTHIVVQDKVTGTIKATGSDWVALGDPDGFFNNTFLAVNDANNRITMQNCSVVIGAAAPTASAVLDVQSTTGAFMVPRMTAAQGSALTPANGMIIYATDTDATFTAAGFWGYEAGAWAKLI